MSERAMKVAREIVLERDRVWCQALIETLPAELIHAVTARMMELRPDQPVPPASPPSPPDVVSE